jgi:hypothetical protein
LLRKKVGKKASRPKNLSKVYVLKLIDCTQVLINYVLNAKILMVG